ncbi:MAG: pyridoxamine 5'-phosphate oxidase family protein [Nitrosopumilus sp. (ex Thoosa mismalolli)]|nr:pyridoxamine 5'-phosphate oxidase family protein [Nitrosopumilus sp. (ex Thoosa mismalolli)]
MQLVGRLQIQSKQKMVEFLNQEHVGRIATIDSNGYPQVIPMNFVFFNDAIYMHSYVKGEKLENIKANSKSGFEVDKELEFLPSYFSSPTDASMADTLYISVVIKGQSVIVKDSGEKSLALNAMMRKYQPEGQYEPLRSDMDVLNYTVVIKVVPEEMTGKYKIGQHMKSESRAILAHLIQKKNSPSAKETLKIMGFEETPDGLKMVDEPVW